MPDILYKEKYVLIAVDADTQAKIKYFFILKNIDIKKFYHKYIFISK